MSDPLLAAQQDAERIVELEAELVTTYNVAFNEGYNACIDDHCVDTDKLPADGSFDV